MVIRSAARLPPDDPLSYAGTRLVSFMPVPCGWCSDARTVANAHHLHEKCIHEVGHYGHLYVCPCDCNRDWLPHAVVIEKGGAVVGSHDAPLARENVDTFEAAYQPPPTRGANPDKPKRRSRSKAAEEQSEEPDGQ